jgi:CheY-like chemotaxis protein
VNNSVRNQRILIVDDVPTNIKVLAEALRGDYEINVATNGKEALEIAGSESLPDLILLDIVMPGMDGYEVCRGLKSDPRTQNIPVIFITAKSDDEDHTKGLELGAVDYINRPFSLPIVKARIRSHLDRRRAEEAQLKVERLSAIADLALGVAHHFNNVLQVVMGCASVASLKIDNSEISPAKEMMGKIVESARFGAQTVMHLQEFVKARSGEIDAPETVDLSEVVQQAIETTRKWWEIEPAKRGITIDVVSDLGKGCRVIGNKSRLFQVVTNMVRNAVEAMPEGGKLSIETSLSNDRVLLNVIDTGAGIPEDYLGKIFDPFFTTKGLQRVGMGLASAYGTVTDHNGTISVKSTMGKGSEFRVTLPAGTEEPEAAERDEPMPVTARMRILVIDDVEPITAVIAEMFREFGHEVVTSLSGREGLGKFEDQSFDLIICDLGMPGIDGWEVGRRIKSMCEKRGIGKVPFVLLTGWGGQLDLKDRIEESGIDAVLQKPLDTLKLLSIVNRLVSVSSSDSSSADRVPGSY